MKDEEWVKWPQTLIAKYCNVTPEYVSRLKSLLSIDRSIDRVEVTRNGTTYTMNTASIGKQESLTPRKFLDEVAPGFTQWQRERETSMPVAVARKLEYMLEDIRGVQDEPDVRLYSLALTQEQIDLYHLPRTPLKSTEKRKDAWEAQHGKDAVELNAIEAQPQYKGELVRIVEETILQYYDEDLTSRATMARLHLVENLQGIQQNVYHRFPQLRRLKDEYEGILKEVAPKLEALNEEIVNLWQEISDELNYRMPDFDDYLSVHPLPEPKIAKEVDDPLYDSKRDYFSQIAVYKQHQKKRVVF